jgi:sulfur relay (sulfurtransferase) DsrF/TusC family protein
MVFVFIGSDWNHHSYQAAFSDKNTFYVFLLLQDYDTESKYVSKISLQKNVEKLKVISKATYVTLQDKSILFSINTSFFQACNA